MNEKFSSWRLGRTRSLFLSDLAQVNIFVSPTFRLEETVIRFMITSDHLFVFRLLFRRIP